MTIGKNSRKSSVRSSIRAPKFMDKSSGFYGRLDEPETATEGVEVRGNEEENRVDDRSREGEVVSSSPLTVTHNSGADEEVFDFTDGMMEDDGETLLHRKPSRLSSRWRRSSRRRQKEGKAEDKQTQDDSSILEDNRMKIEVELKKMEEENEKAGIGKEPTLIHFPVREDADDQVLIRDKKRGREEEGEEERKMKREQEEGMKMVKKNTVKNYRKAFDRAFRRGWEAFIANLYSVTLTPVTSSSPPSSSPSLKKRHQHDSVLAEFQ
ncbi:uncharacterized protein sb:cb1058 [Melanotaenia boesemani]|uniref:uncharacterized protein sb:cb1058 n=1 Tax=Melanotaenia boesemani TaxID=1250792 RepID=UPI001C04E0C8|nr:uncharacterized protein sb:cb1058 [Melanotaenia boesemani]